MSIKVRQIDNENELGEVYKLRYKIYCEEWGFDKPEDHSNRIVTDEYDQNAIHFAARDESEKIVGAVMMIFDSEKGYPIEKYCELDINTEELTRGKLAEIARLVIHRDYRRRAEDKYIYGPDEERRSIGSFDFQHHYAKGTIQYRRADDKYRSRYGSKRTGDLQGDRRKRHEVIWSLYKALYLESKRREISHWYAVMTKGIVNLLNKFGIAFQAIGDPVDYHGIRTPYLAGISAVEQQMSEKYPELYEEFIKGL